MRATLIQTILINWKIFYWETPNAEKHFLQSSSIQLTYQIPAAIFRTNGKRPRKKSGKQCLSQ